MGKKKANNMGGKRNKLTQERKRTNEPDPNAPGGFVVIYPRAAAEHAAITPAQRRKVHLYSK